MAILFRRLLGFWRDWGLSFGSPQSGVPSPVKNRLADQRIIRILHPARNGNSAKTAFGAVAQLGERHVRNVEAVGSIPICSILILSAELAGAPPLKVGFDRLMC